MKILVCDDDKVMTELLAHVLAAWGHESCRVATAQEARRALYREGWDVLLLDLELAAESGLTVTPAALEMEVPVVVLTAHTEPPVVRQMQQLGVLGIVGKWSNGVARLQSAIEAACAGRIYMSPEIKEQLRHSGRWAQILSRHDQALLRRLAAGEDDVEIAAAWDKPVTVNTIQARARRIAKRLGLQSSSRSPLAVWARVNGFAPLRRSPAMV